MIRIVPLNYKFGFLDNLYVYNIPMQLWTAKISFFLYATRRPKKLSQILGIFLMANEIF